MSEEKRFKLDFNNCSEGTIMDTHNKYGQYCKLYDFGQIGRQQIVDLLNEQQVTITQLKEENEVLLENLKERQDYFRNSEKEYHERIMNYQREIKELENTIFNLKNENYNLKNDKDYYTDERKFDMYD